MIDAQRAAPCVSEREWAIDHLDAMQSGDRALSDRGSPAFWRRALHRAQGRAFCMRLSRSRFAAARPFWEADHDSQIITLNPSAAQRRPCCDPGVAAEPLQVRLRGGVTEGLAASLLDEQRYPARLCAALYHQRRLELESFSGFTPPGAGTGLPRQEPRPEPLRHDPSGGR